MTHIAIRKRDLEARSRRLFELEEKLRRISEGEERARRLEDERKPAAVVIGAALIPLAPAVAQPQPPEIDEGLSCAMRATDETPLPALLDGAGRPGSAEESAKRSPAEDNDDVGGDDDEQVEIAPVAGDSPKDLSMTGTQTADSVSPTCEPQVLVAPTTTDESQQEEHIGGAADDGSDCTGQPSGSILLRREAGAVELRQISDGPDAPWAQRASIRDAANMIGVDESQMSEHLSQESRALPIKGWLCRKVANRGRAGQATEVRRIDDGSDAPWVWVSSQSKAALMIDVSSGRLNIYLNRSGGSRAEPGVDPINGWLCRRAGTEDGEATAGEKPGDAAGMSAKDDGQEISDGEEQRYSNGNGVGDEATADRQDLNGARPPPIPPATEAATASPRSTPAPPSPCDRIAAQIGESEAAHAAETAALTARIAALEDEKARSDHRVAALKDEKRRANHRVAALEDEKTRSDHRVAALEAAAAAAAATATADGDELAPRTIARKWETLHTLANTLRGEQRGKPLHALTVRRDNDGRLGLGSVRAVLTKFGGWKRWQVVLQPLRVRFEGEPGEDGGGLTRELFALLFDRLGDLDLFEVTRCDGLRWSRFTRVFRKSGRVYGCFRLALARPLTCRFAWGWLRAERVGECYLPVSVAPSSDNGDAAALERAVRAVYDPASGEQTYRQVRGLAAAQLGVSEDALDPLKREIKAIINFLDEGRSTNAGGAALDAAVGAGADAAVWHSYDHEAVGRVLLAAAADAWSARRSNDYEAVGRVLLAAVARGVPVPSAWASATVVRFLVGDHAGGAFAEVDVRRELATLGVPWQPAWAALTMCQLGFGDGADDDATPCTAHAVWKRLTVHGLRGAALRAMHAGFLGASGSGAAATIAPFAAVLSDWTPRQRQRLLCGDEAFTGADLADRLFPAEESGAVTPSAADMARLRVALIDHLSDAEHRRLLFWATGHRSLTCDTRVEVVLGPLRHLPTAATCTSTLRIPATAAGAAHGGDHENSPSAAAAEAEELASVLRRAMAEGAAFGER